MAVKIANIEVSNESPLLLIAGTCVIESEALAQDVAGHIKEITENLGIPYVFKSSFDKANRTSIDSYRGPGIEEGLRILQSVKEKIGVPVLTDVHEDTPLDEVSSVVDILQTPAFLCRQTNFILKVVAQNIPVNIKKGQFLSPTEMLQVCEKFTSTGNKNLTLCERGTTFGYNDLVCDMRSLKILRQSGFPTILDVTHSIQQPGGKGSESGGSREFIETLAKAGTAVGIAGVFIETHENPETAPPRGQ